jgi:hypothetical protein
VRTQNAYRICIILQGTALGGLCLLWKLKVARKAPPLLEFFILIPCPVKTYIHSRPTTLLNLFYLAP